MIIERENKQIKLVIDTNTRAVMDEDRWVTIWRKHSWYSWEEEPNPYVITMELSRLKETVEALEREE